MAWRHCLIVAACLLAACSTTPSAPAVSATTQSWQFSGKLGLWGENLQESANLAWRDCGNTYRIRLSGPLGSTLAVISGDKEGVTLERNKQETLSAATPDELAELLGWPMPVSALRHWLVGNPVPREPYRGLNSEQDLLQELVQLGWAIQYRYPENAVRSSLPSALQLQDQQWRLKLIIRDWQIPADSCNTL